MNYFQCVGGNGGGGSVLITKTITENGVYNASADNADGYSRVIVDTPVSTGGIPAVKIEIHSATYEIV